MKVGGNRSAGGGRKDGGGRKGGGRKEGRDTGYRFLNNIYIILFRSHSIFKYFCKDFYVDTCDDFHFDGRTVHSRRKSTLSSRWWAHG